VNDNIGNFVVATPLLQMLRAKHEPVEIWYFGGSRTREFEEASDLIDERFEIARADPLKLFSQIQHESIDWVINLERGAEFQRLAGLLGERGALVTGPAIDSEGHPVDFEPGPVGALWNDMDWVSDSVTMKYPFLQTGFIGEMFCRLCYLDGEVPLYSIPVASPNRELPDILISASASLPEKLWTPENWLALIAWFGGEGLSVGLLGAPVKAQRAHWKGADLESQLLQESKLVDLRGELTLPEVAGALSQIRGCITLDNGIMHVACAVSAPTVGLFRYGIHRLWSPPAPSLCAVVAEPEQPVSTVPLEAVKKAWLNLW
jgi:ADP-heptose:LPS heptosyltransferase